MRMFCSIWICNIRLESFHQIWPVYRAGIPPGLFDVVHVACLPYEIFLLKNALILLKSQVVFLGGLKTSAKINFATWWRYISGRKVVENGIFIL